MNVSINPSYFCNFRCEFCYLTHSQLSDPKKLDLNRLSDILREIDYHRSIQHVDLYGGEPVLFGYEYIHQIKNILKSFGIDSINLNTNLSGYSPEIFEDEDLYISVSFDFDARQSSDKVLKNMLKLTRPFSILMLASPELIKHDVRDIVRTLNMFSLLENVEVKPYSPNQANDLKISYLDYENFVKDLIQCSIHKKFRLTNEDNIIASLTKQRNSYSDDHLYITPNGKIAVLDFDLNDREYFKELDSYEQYLIWCAQEKKKVSNNSFCKQCEFSGHCLSEHLRQVKDIKNSCNGFYGLLKWAEVNMD